LIIINPVFKLEVISFGAQIQMIAKEAGTIAIECWDQMAYN